MKRILLRRNVWLVLLVGLTASAVRAEESKLVGDWQLKITTDDGQSLTPKVRISQQDSQTKVLFLSVYGKDVAGEDVALDGDKLKFKVAVDLQGAALVAKFDLHKEADALKGSADYEVAGQIGTVEVLGTRLPPAEATGDKLHQGTWNLEIQTGDGPPLQSSLKLSGEPAQLAGTFIAVDGTESKISEAAVEGESLTFKVAIEFQGSPLTARFNLKQEGSGLKGTIDYDLGGQAGTLQVVGKRPAAKNPGKEVQKVAGKWDYDVTGDDGNTTKARVQLQADGDKLTGSVILPDGREAKLESASYDGDELKFKVNVDLGGAALVARVHGKVDGDNIKGEVEFDVNGQSGTLQFTGKRASGG